MGYWDVLMNRTEVRRWQVDCRILEVDSGGFSSQGWDLVDEKVGPGF